MNTIFAETRINNGTADSLLVSTSSLWNRRGPEERFENLLYIYIYSIECLFRFSFVQKRLRPDTKCRAAILRFTNIIIIIITKDLGIKSKGSHKPQSLPCSKFNFHSHQMRQVHVSDSLIREIQ